MDRLESVRVFVAIVEHGSLSAAAHALDMSRAMVTRHLAHLESWAGARLLHRTTRRIGLTGAGEATLARCKGLLALANDVPLPETQPAGDGQLQGLLRITCPRMLAARVLARAIADFQRRHPRVRIDLQVSNATVNLVEERIDLALRITREPAPGLIARPLGDCASVICAAPGYLASRGTPAGPLELTAHNCLGYQYFGHALWHFTHPDGELAVAVEGNLSANESDALLAATLAGAGISQQPRFAVAPLIAQGRLIALFPHYRPRLMRLYAVYVSRRNMPAALSRLIAFLADWLPADPVWRDAA
ncbi:LysR family transcriptional regulator [Verticiella sediminum]|uniref:LysR family transcriptional regulator n=1 Tax=Verticiella sediminum TaxID=1247510 RepID=A0A556B0D2_9BURK|nr:LysR family transcriptional regulator [Verticiella sediminum]TSH98620.1 LysR family transcriptional regulator [Verticiella sediminum]